MTLYFTRGSRSVQPEIRMPGTSQPKSMPAWIMPIATGSSVNWLTKSGRIVAAEMRPIMPRPQPAESITPAVKL
jgi:hypothetical protein